MVNRREMLAGTLAGAAGAALPDSAVAGQDRESEMVSLLQDIRDLLGRGVGPQYGPLLLQVRQAQHAHLRATGTFPQFIDVGNEVWDQAYDWHVINQRPIEVARVGDRYQMTFLYTTLVLRPDSTPTFIGAPTDVRQP